MPYINRSPYWTVFTRTDGLPPGPCTGWRIIIADTATKFNPGNEQQAILVLDKTDLTPGLVTVVLNIRTVGGGYGRDWFATTFGRDSRNYRDMLSHVNHLV